MFMASFVETQQVASLLTVELEICPIRAAASASVCSDARSLLSRQSSYRDSADSSGESGPVLQLVVAATDYSALPAHAASPGEAFESGDSCLTRVTVLGATVHTSLVQSVVDERLERFALELRVAVATA